MTIHIISFNVPYPPNYGGIIDVFYKIKYLYMSSVQIVLHTFDYGRSEQEELKKYCKEVYYYKRSKSLFKNFSSTPFIVKSRENKKLLRNLLKDNHPILFEGIHTTSFLNHPKLSQRKKLVRAHNIEHDYYKGLFSNEKKLLKKLFFYLEFLKLKGFEKKLKSATRILTVSPNDNYHFNQKFESAKLVSSFHSNTQISTKEGKGSYLLYHANLSVAENIYAAKFLINITKKTKFKLILAGKDPERKLIGLCEKHANVSLVKNPSIIEMNKFISEAQIICLPTNQATGLKLKLIDSLYQGRHILCSHEMIKDLKIDSICHTANTTSEWLNQIEKLMNETISEEEIQKRKKILKKKFSNEKNLKTLMGILKGRA